MMTTALYAASCSSRFIPTWLLLGIFCLQVALTQILGHWIELFHLAAIFITYS